MRVLVVDDEIEKVQEICNVLDNANIGAVVTHQTSALGARQALRASQFDILIIDLNLPDTVKDQARPEGGIGLLEMLTLDEQVILPSDVLFITGREELVEQAREKTNERGALLLEYRDPVSWKQILLGRAKYRHKQMERKGPVRVHIAIITALYQPELAAVLNLPYSWVQKRFNADPTLYHFGYFIRDGQTVSVVAACALRKGMPSSAALASKLVTQFAPQYVVMLGICAGIPGKTNLGDVVVADPAWDYGSGKRALNPEGSPVFLSAPYQMHLSADTKGLAEQLGRDPIILSQIRAGWVNAVPAGVLSVHVGPMASGASVIADDQQAREVALQNRELIAIEMEAYAVMAAVEYASTPKPTAIAIKSVCDYADEKKCDDWQAYAAYTSAAFADNLFRNPNFSIADL